LFSINYESKLSDEQLRVVIRRHYPTSLLDRKVGRHRDRLGIWRSEYNRGRLGGTAPKVFSVAYLNKKPVTPWGNELDLTWFNKRNTETKQKYEQFLKGQDDYLGSDASPKGLLPRTSQVPLLGYTKD